MKIIERNRERKQAKNGRKEWVIGKKNDENMSCERRWAQSEAGNDEIKESVVRKIKEITEI